MKRACVLAGIAFLATLLWGTPAVAAIVSSSGLTFHYSAAQGEANQVTASIVGGTFTVRDSGATITTFAGSGCTVVSAHEARCASSFEPSRLAYFIVVDNLNDSVVIDAAPASMFNEISGGEGNDDLRGGPGDDQIRGDAGDDSLRGLGGDDGFPADDGADEIHGGAGRDGVSYSSRNVNVAVTLDGSDDDGNAADGPAGNRDNVGGDVEMVTGSTAGDVIVGGGAANLLYGYEGDDVVSGGDGDDDLLGGSGTDVLNGGQGEDVFEYDAWGGADVLNGGPGTDLADYGGRFGPVRVDLDGEAGDDGENGEGDTVGVDVEDARGGDAHDTLIGNSQENWLRGGDGADVLEGLGGADILDGDPTDGFLVGFLRTDTLRGGEGDDVLAGAFEADLIVGGGGFDVADYSDHTADVAADLDHESGDDGAVGEGDTLAADVEGLTGGGGDDELVGDEGTNQLDGGPGDDFLDGGLGSDRLIGSRGLDLVDYAGRTAALTLDLDGESGDDGEAGEQDSLALSLEAVIAGSGGDVLIGNGEDNLLFGGPGADRLDGGAGDDLLDGGSGGDALGGGSGFDLADYADRTNGVAVDLDGAVGDDGEAGEGDSAALDVEDLRGGSGNDVLTGNAGENLLFGVGGNDVLDGGPAADLLAGGAGDDRIMSRDEAPDVDECGDGESDSAVADWIDEFNGCELLTRPTPSVATGTATDVTQTSAKISGTVLPFGASTTLQFEFGPTPQYGGNTATTTIAAGVAEASASATLTGLTPGTEYHYRLLASNAAGASYGADRTFTTATTPVPPRPPARPQARPKAKRCVVPNVKGKTLPRARNALKRSRCTGGKVKRLYSRTVKKGRVIAQKPRPGTKLPQRGRVSLVVSRGRRR